MKAFLMQASIWINLSILKHSKQVRWTFLLSLRLFLDAAVELKKFKEASKD